MIPPLPPRRETVPTAPSPAGSWILHLRLFSLAGWCLDSILCPGPPVFASRQQFTLWDWWLARAELEGADRKLAVSLSSGSLGGGRLFRMQLGGLVELEEPSVDGVAPTRWTTTWKHNWQRDNANS